MMLSFLGSHSIAQAQTHEVADSLWDEAVAADEAGDILRVAQLFEQSAEVELKSESPRQEGVYYALRNASYYYHQVNEFEKAFELRKESLQKSIMVFGKEHVNYANEAGWVGWYYENIDQYGQALPFYLEALEIIEKILGKEHSDYGKRLNDLAVLYKNMGLYEEALPLYLKALENAEKLLGKDHLEYGKRLNNLAVLYESMGQYDEALPLYYEALENTEKTLGKEHSDYGILLNNLAVLHEKMGQYSKALPLKLEALETIEKALGKEHSSYGTALNNLAELYRTMGQHDKALPLYIEALENTEKVLGKEHSDYGIRLNNLAALYKTMGLYDEALPLYLDALDNLEKALGKEHSSYGIFLNNLAGLYESMSQYNKALPLYLEALENAENSLGKEHSSYGISLNNLAFLYESMGQIDKAMPLYLEALENTENSLGKEHSSYGTRLNNLAGLYENMGRYEKAFNFYLEDQKLKLNLLERNFSFISENEQVQYAKTLNYNFEIYQSFYTRHFEVKPEVATHAFDVELATKGMILQSGINMRQAILSSGDAEALELFDEWILHKNLLSGEYNKPIAERRKDLDELEQAAERLEADLTRMSQTFGNVREIGGTSWRDVQRQLKTGQVAIEFSSFQYHNNQSFTDSTLYTAIVLRPDDEQPHMIPLFEQSQLDSLLSRRGTSDADFVSGMYRTLSRNIETVNYGKQLYELIWEPLETYLNPGETVYFAPSGNLHQIAFAAIPVAEDTLLSDRYQLHHLSTTARLLEDSRFTEPLPANIALYGGIDYDLEPEQLLAHAAIPNDYEHVSRSLPDDLSRGETWTYLPGTLTEVQAIEALAQHAGVSTDTYTGAEATEVVYKMQSGNESPQVLHIATHGFFFPDPERQTPEDGALLMEESQVFKTSENPLQRSGILFAGANQAWSGEPLPDQIEDGILTAYEVGNVMLGNTQLVVLSACETGLGDILGSEGVFGLQRAFKAAGAEYLLMSLWKVPDKETAEFMTYFYEKWFSGSNIEQSFHATQHHMKEIYPDDPYKWAAFVLLR